ncbi:MAG: penicillin-binding protein 2 [Cryobacterium sp.]|nr:penicillin-binding protein 2 [Cryobacterium sp.]MBX3103835.1 penicillin-binding protein 2 [Cryobacterium sp.]
MRHQRAARKRISMAVVFSLLVTGIFLVRLVDLQVVRAAELNAQSLGKRGIEVAVHAPRGKILDANGVVLADSVTRFDITAAPKNVKDFNRLLKDGSTQKVTVLEAINEIAEITKSDPSKLLASATADPKASWAMLVPKVDLDTYRAVRKLAIPWVYSQTEEERIYPAGSVAGNLVGFVGTDKPLNGLEATENSCLASKDGVSTYEQGADGVQIPGSTVTTTEAIPGGDLKLTIDSDLQWFVQQAIAEQAQAIGAESAMAGVVRVSDGHLMALADYPAVDPNDVGATKVDFYGSRSFNYMFEPGSIMKAITASMLINEGEAGPTTEVTVPGIWHTPDGARIQDSTRHGEMHWTMTGVLEQSSNVGMSMLGTRLSSKIRLEYLHQYGFGKPTTVHFQGEAAGILASQWNTQQNYDTTYGQGIAVTFAQMLAAYQALANGGVQEPLTLVESCTKPDGTVENLSSGSAHRIISAEASKTTLGMLESVVTGGWLSTQLTIPGYRIAAKTGTAQVALPTGGYGNDYIVSVAGIAPADNPQYVVIVTYVKPHIMKSSAAAAPTFRKIMSQVLKVFRVPPSTSPGPGYPTTW